MSDPNDQLMKPFYHGWKREIVYRNMNENEKQKMDVYYYAPDGKKLRSSNEVTNYLRIHQTDLTASCFSFAKRHLHCESYEFIRHANKRKPRDLVNHAKPKKIKPSKSITNKERKEEEEEDVNEDDSGDDEYPSRGAQQHATVSHGMKRTTLIPSLLSPPLYPPPTSPSSSSFNCNVDKKLVMNKFLMNFDKSFMEFKSLLRVFKYLGLRDLLVVSLTCKIWRRASLHHSLWDSVKLKGVCIVDWARASDFFNRRATRLINFNGLRIPPKTPLKTYWSCVANSMGKLKFLKFIDLGMCKIDILHILASGCFLEQIHGFTCTVDAVENDIHDCQHNFIQNDLKPQDSNNELNMTCMNRCRSLKALKIGSNSNFHVTSVQEISTLENLQALSLTTVVSLKENSLECLAHLPHLRVLEFGYCSGWQSWVFDDVSHCKTLTSLELACQNDIQEREEDIDCDRIRNIFRSMDTIKRLELIDFRITTSIIDILIQQCNLKTLSVHTTVDDLSTKIELNEHLIKRSKFLNFLDVLEWKVSINVDDVKDEGSTKSHIYANDEEILRRFCFNLPTTKIVL